MAKVLLAAGNLTMAEKSAIKLRQSGWRPFLLIGAIAITLCVISPWFNKLQGVAIAFSGSLTGFALIFLIVRPHRQVKRLVRTNRAVFLTHGMPLEFYYDMEVQLRGLGEHTRTIQRGALFPSFRDMAGYQRTLDISKRNPSNPIAFAEGSATLETLLTIMLDEQRRIRALLETPRG